MRHVVMFSGGVGSWAAAKRVAARHGTADLTLLFTDTLIEDADLYRFLVEGAANVLRRQGHPLLAGMLKRARQLPPSTDMAARRAALDAIRERAREALPELEWIVEGRTPWEVFRDERYLGNTRADPCSRVLKREVADRWLAARCDPTDTVAYVGIDWTESHRIERLAARRAEVGWRYEAPMCEAPYMDKPAMLAWLQREDIPAPRLYALGFAHNNCGGGCVKAGQGHFANLLRTLPDVFAEWERNEEAIRAQLGDVAMLRDRSGGGVTPLPLAELRRRMDAGYQPDLFEIGGCGCFVDTATQEAE